jgi:tripartite-type tricarboxylate transporter receptor subunit TctC
MLKHDGQTLRILALATAFAGLLGAQKATAQEQNFYQGKTIKIVVGYAPGSSYDGFARVIAQFAPQYIPGQPHMVVENMPGAGSLTALNHVVNIAPQDGTVIGAIGATLPFGPLLGEKSARFDALKLNWLPSPGSDTSALTVWHTAPAKTLEEARKNELILASNAVTGSSSLYGRLLGEVLGLKIRLVYGYTGGVSDALLATEKGEVHGHPSVSWGVIKSRADWMRDRKIRLLTYFGGPKNPEIEAYDGAVYADDLVKPGPDRQLWDLGMAPSTLGRPYVMGPGVPKERVKIVADAMMKAFANPEVKSAAARQQLEIDPLSREKVQDVIEKTYASPKETVDRLVGLFGERR